MNQQSQRSIENQLFSRDFYDNLFDNNSIDDDFSEIKEFTQVFQGNI